MPHGRIRRGALIAGVIAALALAVPAGAITNGQPDGGGTRTSASCCSTTLTTRVRTSAIRAGSSNCSGTLISPTVVLTAGHCTFGTAHDGESTLPDGWGGNDTILDEPYNPPGNVDFARLPGVNYLDQFAGKAKAQTLFEAVGYGLEYSGPKVELGGDTRMKSQQVIVNSKGVYGTHDKSSIVFSNNNGKPHRGGTCSGDSGGPFFLDNTDLQVAVNSHGVPPNCTGGDGAYRIDQPDDVAWLAQVLAGTDPRFGS